MKNELMNIPRFRFILLIFKIFGEINICKVTRYRFGTRYFGTRYRFQAESTLDA